MTGKTRKRANKIRTGATYNATYNKAVRRLRHDRGGWSCRSVRDLAHKRPRKLLLHRKQISKLIGAIQREGRTVVPLQVYFNPRGRAKIEIALVTGKQAHDKRQSIKTATGSASAPACSAIGVRLHVAQDFVSSPSRIPRRGGVAVIRRRRGRKPRMALMTPPSA